MTTIYLVRHAQSDGNNKSLFQGITDCELSENGLKQLEFLAERFKDIKIDKVYSSPLKRTRATAGAINKYHNHDIIIDDGLIELNGGIFENRTWDDLYSSHAKEMEIWENSHHLFEIEKGETMKQLYDRITKTILNIVKENEGKTIAIASHGCAIRTFLCFANRIEFSRIGEIEWCGNTGVTKVEFDDNLIPNLIFQSDVSHLSENVVCE